jgi:hypothetical protein
MATPLEREYSYLIDRAERQGRLQLAEQLRERAFLYDVVPGNAKRPATSGEAPVVLTAV